MLEGISQPAAGIPLQVRPGDETLYRELSFRGDRAGNLAGRGELQVLVAEDAQLDGQIRAEDPSNDLLNIPGFFSAWQAESVQDWPLVWFPVLGESRVNQLQKIAASAKRIEYPAAERDPAMAHMFIINPLSGERMDNLFSTHPNTENRIAALQEMAQGMQARSTEPVRADNPVRKSRSVPTTGWGRGGSEPPKGPWS